MTPTGDAPGAMRPALRSIAERLELPLSDAQIDALLAYVAMLQRWNATYNLTSIRDPAQMLTHHVADCLAVMAPLNRRLTMDEGRLLDVGSGAGLPGVVISIACPGVDVRCIDSVGKKSAFVQQVAAELALSNLHAQHVRAQDLRAGRFDVISSRAFSSLSELVDITRAHLARAGAWMAMKGAVPTDEIKALPADVEVFHVEQLRVPELDAERCIVWMRPTS